MSMVVTSIKSRSDDILCTGG